MGELAKFLKQPTVTEPSRKTAYATSDGVQGKIVTEPLDRPPTAHRELLEKFGYDPDRFRMVADGHETTRWQGYDGRWLSRYKFRVLEKPSFDLEELIKDVKAFKPAKVAPVTGNGVFVFQASDLQLGKIDGYGVEGTVDRYLASVSAAVAELKVQRKRYGITAAHLIFAGDCMENGGVSQGGKLAWRQSLTITEQVRLWRRLLLSTVKSFAPLVDELVVSVVGGNHDDATRIPVQTRADDNWATEGAIAVHDALAESPEKFGHVKVLVPPVDQGYMTVQVGDSIFTIAHGHQWRKGKAADWWASQAFYQGNPSDADFLCHGHWHSTSISQDGPRTIVCSPTFDGGSMWYRDKTGAESRQGGLVYVTQGAEFFGLSLV